MQDNDIYHYAKCALCEFFKYANIQETSNVLFLLKVESP